jgi:F-type H+-transporting ATPase subunit gamma
MSLETLGKRIKTTHDLRGIVSMMKMLSSVSIMQYDKALVSIKEYGKTVEEGFLGLILNDGYNAQMPRKNPKKTDILAILIGSDNGLVGRFNREVLLKSEEYFNDNGYAPKQVGYICVGKKLGLLLHEKKEVHATYAISNSIKEIAGVASTLLLKINEIAAKRQIEKVFIVYNNRPLSKNTEENKIKPRVIQLMPLPGDAFFEMKGKKWDGKTFPFISADKKELLSALLHEYLTVVLSHTLTSSLASEHYTRMVNMQEAEKKIDENLQTMDLEYSLARQNEITDELIDIVSGAESLKKKT